MIKPTEIHTWKTLIIDDEPDNLDVAEKVLSFNGADVQTATNGVEGLEKLKTEDNDYTFILLDLSMPQMDGWTMYSKMQDDDRLKDIPVIALTAHAMEADRERAIALGFDGYITKPFRIDNFLSNIQTILKRLAEGQTQQQNTQHETQSQPNPQQKS
jgi:CheY-like chemotaxis protein